MGSAFSVYRNKCGKFIVTENAQYVWPKKQNKALEDAKAKLSSCILIHFDLSLLPINMCQGVGAEMLHIWKDRKDNSFPPGTEQGLEETTLGLRERNWGRRRKEKR